MIRSILRALRLFNIAIAPLDVPAAHTATEPQRPEYPCGIPDCYVMQNVVRMDGRYIVVECPEHQCVTSWDTVKRPAGEQRIIRVQDNWRQHGTSGRPK